VKPLRGGPKAQRVRHREEIPEMTQLHIDKHFLSLQ
jgi:hypothetical protein